MNEKELREMKVSTPKNQEELIILVNDMIKNNNDDYGKAVYAISIATTAMFNYMCSEIGATGFQASCADLDVLARTRGMKDGFKVLDFNNLLYPQYIDKFELSFSKVLEDNIKHIGEKAKENLSNNEGACKEVIDHWEMIADLHNKYVIKES